ncbi:CRISPR-associated endoribonuclease Cas6 [Nocardiopsis ansamitocini]|uniref:CRISPR associated protein Cas6 C-terminal domain-containing protein n=1 Tax=Nocardiopsis ansamitocini TaxID=1670832 RepID=A0A9W6P348_9ACTN|nr:CRISPR-associated endoribonuclease Cas6 [Nocardiopsis ansamitocini]GLU46286.1 hypothetical protein Nans01_06370 [Nocardiopsis ansamitocini]
MRLRVGVRTSATSLPWAQVLKPGRGLVYDLLAHGAPEVGARLHEEGTGPFGMVPFGHGAPMFASARRKRGVYAVGGSGCVELGSPLPDVVHGLAKGLVGREVVDWGGTAFRIESVSVLEAPAFASGRARLRTSTPVVMKGSGRDDEGVRAKREAWVLPEEAEFAQYFAQNLRRKAVTLGLDEEVSVEAVTWVGPKRSFAVGGGLKPGAPVEVELVGAPEVLQGIWSWGLGQANSAGFGWVAA